ncbi:MULTISPECIES: L-glyceraldehyde 3-phosphate reductase [Deefgea]|uniref:L-glyceraldehyde 3-phosphate reductase n=1 Tax=Deefgea chitinilytica TaxID=570276 RepID=A0ABS2C963_9NEIS|nr:MULTISPECIES: L-glyceraldehyde 3-phosphate reductase [Deefgea]MBM5570690.1 L-glyceraldehyde 3-phosphate reductase [Deefgea chitinilytica]MBM9887919.1 L-glyceraldehyde 3-phosphate reductase [Deefgea sp. CFH1-16]
MSYRAAANRYEVMPYRRCGRSGLKLPAISLGLWHNFGDNKPYENSRAMLLRAFDLGITHFDLANNYGPRPGAAEETFGRVLKQDLRAYRDEMIVSTKAGWEMWPGPYGEWGSRKYLMASLDQSLSRLGLDYVDIFYSHRPDPETPMEETMSALDAMVRQGKALYVGISSYSPAQTVEAARILKELGTPCLIHQPKYSMFERDIERGLLDVLAENGIGSIAFCPLAQGLLTGRYLAGIPQDSRAAALDNHFLDEQGVALYLSRAQRLNQLAQQRGQTLAQMALAWALLTVTSVIVGASRVSQLEENVGAVANMNFSAAELLEIEAVLASM